MSSIIFSIIIPHKNIPDLLQRCLDSIPMRDDIQVIVVDDNSSPGIVDFNHFPIWNGAHYEYYLTKEGRGAGYARNVGLLHATGKWVLFADSDDFFSPEITCILDRWINNEADVVYFCHNAVVSSDISLSSDRCFELNQYIYDFIETDSELDIRYRFDPPWCKIISRSFIEKYQIRFHETRWANDVFFSTHIGCVASKLSAEETVGYTTTVRPDSLAYDFCGSYRETIVRLSEVIQVDKLLVDNNVDREAIRTYLLLNYLYYEKGAIWMLLCGISAIAKPAVYLHIFYFLIKRSYKQLFKFKK